MEVQISEYNHALFDNMAFFADAVWELNAKNETVFFLHNKLLPQFMVQSFSFSDFHDVLRENTHPDICNKLIPMINSNYIRNLTESDSFQGRILVEGSYQALRCVITPSFEKNGQVNVAYITLQNIQEQINEKEEVKKSKQELDRYLQAVSCGIIQYKRLSKELIFANDIALKILGYSSIEEMQNDNFNGIVNTILPEDAEIMRKRAKELKEDGDVVELEYRVMHPDGTIITCFGNLRLLCKDEEEPIIQSSMIDITERRKTGKLYRELTEVLNGAHLGLWYFILDEGEPRFIIDSVTADLVGCSEKISPEKAFKYWFSRVDPDFKTHVDECVEKMRRGEFAEVTYTYHHPTRGEITVRCGGFRNKSYSGAGLMIRGYHQDITDFSKRISEEKEKEQSERDSLQSIASIYRTMHILDLENQSFEERSACSSIHDYVEAHSEEELQNIMEGALSLRFIGSHLEAAQKFSNLNTIKERMEGETSISFELIDIENLWCRLSFIRIGDPGKPLTKVIFASQNIDKEKRREENLILLSNTDELTRLFNRHAYEIDIKEIEKDGISEDLWFMGVDLNGLKAANDSQGHKAGDELLQATAECLRQAVSSSGKVYRVGGDEFICIFNATDKDTLDMIKKINDFQKDWHGKLNESFSFSKGLVCAKEIENCTIAKLEKESDRRMYSEKREYYKTRTDRRKE